MFIIIITIIAKTIIITIYIIKIITWIFLSVKLWVILENLLDMQFHHTFISRKKMKLHFTALYPRHSSSAMLTAGSLSDLHWKSLRITEFFPREIYGEKLHTSKNCWWSYHVLTFISTSTSEFWNTTYSRVNESLNASSDLLHEWHEGLAFEKSYTIPLWRQMFSDKFHRFSMHLSQMTLCLPNRHWVCLTPLKLFLRKKESFKLTSEWVKTNQWNLYERNISVRSTVELKITSPVPVFR